MAHEGIHEDASDLDPATIEAHRAILSIMEELEAVDWYQQRADATDDTELAAIMRHNRDEEKEHAVMTLEWLRRRDRVLDAQLREYMFTDGSIVEREHTESSDAESGQQGSGSLGVGSLRGRTTL